jgi:hypothetical protein
MSKQTAVEWLHVKLSTSSSDELVGNINNWFEQAKQIEKEQLNNFIDFINERHFNRFRISKDEAEIYYNETYDTNTTTTN